jgi:hypothetical protein
MKWTVTFDLQAMSDVVIALQAKLADCKARAGDRYANTEFWKKRTTEIQSAIEQANAAKYIDVTDDKG